MAYDGLAKTNTVFRRTTKKEGESMLSISVSNGIVVHQLRKALAAYGLKQAEIARKAGFTAQEMNDMLAGRRLIRVADIDSILKVIGKPQIDANYLFGMNKEIQVLSDDNELIASITNENVIVTDGYKVVCVPIDD